MFFSVLAFIAMGPAKDWIFSAITRYWPGSGWVPGPEQMAALDRIRFPSLATMVGIALFSLGTIVALRRSLMKVAFGLSVLMMVPIFVMVHWGFLVMEPFMSSRQIAEIVQRNTRPGDIVVSYEPHEYMWIGGLTFYTGHPVYILKDPKFEGVTSRRREPAERFLDQEDLLKIWGAGKRVVLVFEGENPILSRLSSVKPFQVLGTCGGKTVLAPAPNDTGPTGGG
jgi:hypothetical protein